jgi:hypothetical protein
VSSDKSKFKEISEFPISIFTDFMVIFVSIQFLKNIY